MKDGVRIGIGDDDIVEIGIVHNLIMGTDNHFHIVCNDCVDQVKGYKLGISSDTCEICGKVYRYGAGTKTESKQLEFELMEDNKDAESN